MVNWSSSLSRPCLISLNTIFQRHQLGETCRLDRLIGVLLKQNAVALRVDQDGVGDAGLECVVLVAGHTRWRRAP